MRVKDYKAPEQLEVDRFFKRNPLSNWMMSPYFEWHKKLDPFILFSTCQINFNNDLETIKTSDLVPRDVKSQIELLKKNAKGKGNKKKEARQVININYGNTYNDNATHNGDTIINTSTMDEAGFGPSNSLLNSNNGEISKRTFEETISTEVRSNSISSLFSYMYKLYKSQPVDIDELEKLPATSINNSIYNACIGTMKSFDKLSPVQRSHLHVLLSSCLNTINANYRTTLQNIIGADALQTILICQTDLSFSVYSDPRWTNIKDSIKEAFKINGKKGVRKYILKERQRIYENDLDVIEAFEMKILDVYDFILNMVSYSKWTGELSEEDFGFYWKFIIEMLFRGSKIELKRGESSCLSSKYERQLNEYEYGDVLQNIFGRRIDLLLVAPVVNDKNAEQNIELSSLEVKPAGVSADVEIIQLNKNIRVNKSILHNIITHMGGIDDHNLRTLGMDIIGLTAFTYSLVQYEDITVAIKISEENMFLPSDDDDLEEFIDSDTMDQLLNYVDYISKLYIQINKASKKYKRLRTSSKNSCSITPRLQSPPKQQYPFPADTFYTPKKTTTKKD